MEDGHTIFDYNVGLNDIVQLLVRQSLPQAPLPKEKEAELSDSDSGCGSAQSESDKGSTHGEGDGQTAGSSAQTDALDLIDPGFGFYKVSWRSPRGGVGIRRTDVVPLTAHRVALCAIRRGCMSVKL